MRFKYPVTDHSTISNTLMESRVGFSSDGLRNRMVYVFNAYETYVKEKTGCLSYVIEHIRRTEKNIELNTMSRETVLTLPGRFTQYLFDKGRYEQKALTALLLTQRQGFVPHSKAYTAFSRNSPLFTAAT